MLFNNSSKYSIISILPSLHQCLWKYVFSPFNCLTVSPICKSTGDQNTASVWESIWSASTQTQSLLRKRKKKEQRCINSTRSLKAVALWSGVKRWSSAAFTACALKDTFNYRQRKLGRHAASIITTLQLTHHCKNRLAETSSFSTQKYLCAHLLGLLFAVLPFLQ